MRRQLLVGVGVVAAIIIAIIASGTRSSTDKKPAPALPTQVLAGSPVTINSLRGKPAAINFWASWCDPCRHEAPGFARLPQQLGGHARLVAVDWNDSESDARAFVKKYGWHFPVLRDASGTVGNHYGLTGLPTTFILDRRARIAKVLRGPQTADQIKAQLDAVSR